MSLEAEYRFIMHTNREQKSQYYEREYKLSSIAKDNESDSTKLQWFRRI